jgi:hypothetical protein
MELMDFVLAFLAVVSIGTGVLIIMHDWLRP